MWFGLFFVIFGAGWRGWFCLAMMVQWYMRAYKWESGVVMILGRGFGGWWCNGFIIGFGGERERMGYRGLFIVLLRSAFQASRFYY